MKVGDNDFTPLWNHILVALTCNGYLVASLNLLGVYLDVPAWSSPMGVVVGHKVGHKQPVARLTVSPWLRVVARSVAALLPQPQATPRGRLGTTYAQLTATIRFAYQHLRGKLGLP